MRSGPCARPRSNAMHPTIVATERMSAMVELHPPGGRPCGRPYSPSTHDACQRIARDCKGLRAAGEGPAGELHDAACTQPALCKARPWPPRCGAPEVGEQAPRAGRSPAEVRTQWGARGDEGGPGAGPGGGVGGGDEAYSRFYYGRPYVGRYEQSRNGMASRRKAAAGVAAGRC